MWIMFVPAQKSRLDNRNSRRVAAETHQSVSVFIIYIFYLRF